MAAARAEGFASASDNDRAYRLLGILAVGALVALPLTAGCSLIGDSVEIAIVLPPTPSLWEPVVQAEGRSLFLVRSPGRGREVEERVVAAPDRAGLPACRVVLPKRANRAVVAFPVVQGRPDLLKPSGALFPSASAGGDSLRLSYRDGFVALLLSKLSERGQLVESLNSERLQAEIQKRSGGDPWLIDGEAILGLLAGGSFRADRIVRLPAYELALSCAPGSRWAAGDPFLPELRGDAGGTLTLVGIVPGFHCLFRVDTGDGSSVVGAGVTGGMAGGIERSGGGIAAIGEGGRGVGPTDLPRGTAAALPLERIDLFVSEEEWFACNSLTGVAEYGRW